MSSPTDKELFNKLKQQLLMIDPVTFIEKYLTLDGKPFRLHGNGYRPFVDMYRYIGINALDANSMPICLVKSRQTGGTTMANALEMYFMGSGLFGGTKPPIRIMHVFPQLEMAASYSKTKLNAMISSSILADEQGPKGSRQKTHMQSLLDQSTATNDSLHFKQFVGGNHLWIESTGLDADRLRGRQLSLEIELPTPTGFIKLKDLKEGDQLFDEQGNICNITKLHPINLTPEAYEIIFDDGSKIKACADHLWITYTKRDRIKLNKFYKKIISQAPTPTIKTTSEILNTLKIGGKNPESNHSIPNAKPINYVEKEQKLCPYLFGLWLGDGDSRGCIETMDPEILNNYEHRILPSSNNRKLYPNSFGISKSKAYRVIGLTTKLREIEVLRNTHNKVGDYYNKHIPDNYLYGSFEQRLALLQGLMDTDGTVYKKDGRCEFTQVRENLAFQVYQLILSLGIKTYIHKKKSMRYGKRYQDKYCIIFSTNLPVFRLKRKLDKMIVRKNCTMIQHRYITAINKIPSEPMRCITVNSPNHLYLISKNFIPTHNTSDIIFFDECQKISGTAIGNSLKILNTAKYGKPGKGVQVFFGTPLRKGSDFHKMWLSSSQQYYYLGCEKCKEYFPLYTPESDDWKKIWIHGFIVKCTKCGYEQDKRQAAERGKWMQFNKSENVSMVGFHINQIYMPFISREDMDGEMPGKHPINTERVFQNEVLGEFYQGDSSPITPDEIREACADVGRKFSPRIISDKETISVLGIDYGARADLEQLANPDKVKATGQSYSTAVVLLAKGPGLLSIEFATKFKRNDIESKKGIIDQLIRQYGITLAVGDIGYSNDFSEILHNSYGDRYIVSRAHNKINGHVKYNQDAFPKEIIFERDHYIGEMYDQMKKGMIRFPYGDYEKVAWLIEHCASMEIKPSISRTGDPSIHYVKGSTPNDGFMALLNAYIAYKFLISKGFTNNNPHLQNQYFTNKSKPLAVTGYIPRRF